MNVPRHQHITFYAPQETKNGGNKHARRNNVAGQCKNGRPYQLVLVSDAEGEVQTQDSNRYTLLLHVRNFSHQFHVRSAPYPSVEHVHCCQLEIA
ncbi:hypothetical protein WAI453_012980 [Rhynchosporium graminicola]